MPNTVRPGQRLRLQLFPARPQLTNGCQSESAWLDAFAEQLDRERNDNGPVLVAATLPRNQDVADAHSPRGAAALGLPATNRSRARRGAVLGFDAWFWS